MPRPFVYLICALAAFLTLSAETASAAPRRWDVTSINGTEYVRVKDLCDFYRFSPRKGRSGFVSYGAGNRTVSLRANRQDFYVNNYRYILSYPVRRIGSELYISTTDIKKLVDPVLRPRYSTEASTVRTVVIDPGHGGHDAGAVSPWAREKDCNLAVALKLRDKLVARGYKVVMTREDDRFLTLQQRVRIANRIPDSVFVSIHHNSSGRHATGIETFTLAPHGTTSPFARTRRFEELAGNDQDSENIALATSIHSRAIKSTGADDRGIQRARFSVLCTICRPAILFEGGFVSNPEEGRRIVTEDYQNKLADSICDGIVNYTAVVSRSRIKPTGNRRMGATSIGGRSKRSESAPSASRGSATRIHGNNNYRGTTRL